MLRILVADDHEAVRRGVRGLISGREDWEVCAEAASLSEAESAVVALRPDIVILDLGITGSSPLEGVQRIRTLSPQAEVLIFTMHEGEEVFLTLISAGIRGYVFKSDSATEIEAAIEALGNHKLYFTSKISGILREAYLARSGAQAGGHAYISQRKRQIVQLLAEGRCNKDAAKALGISARTVETHRATVMRKLGLGSVVELAHYAVRNRIVLP